MGICACKAKIVNHKSGRWDGKWSWEKLQADWQSLKAGDIILVTYRKGAVNRIVGALNSGYWDHISVVVHGFDRSSWNLKPSAPPWVDSHNAKDSGPQIMESSRDGTHIYDLLDRLTDPEARKFHRHAFSVRRLEGIERTPEFYKTVEQLVQEVIGNPYSSVVDLALTSIRCNVTKDCKTVHCSQLAALLYQRLGLLPPQINCKKFQPGDFSTYGNRGKFQIDNVLAKHNTASLHTEELIFFEGQNDEHDRLRKNNSKGTNGEGRRLQRENSEGIDAEGPASVSDQCQTIAGPTTAAGKSAKATMVHPM